MFYINVYNKNTHTLKVNTNDISLQIKPLFSTIKVTSDADTDVVFTDVISGQTYIIGYVTPGLTEKIKLPKGKWYTVSSKSNLTIRPINVRAVCTE